MKKVINTKLPIVEEFYTIQGEGFHTGKPAYFLRIGGCDICCNWCDAKFTWNPEHHPLVEIDDVIKRIVHIPAKAIVVTGGEPLSYNLDYLCLELKNVGFETFLETSGCYELTGMWDWICLSPKEKFPPVGKIYKLANELKVVISSEKDFKWAEENAQKISGNCKLFLQPEWSVYNNIIEKVVDYVKTNPKWNISLQSHKFMNIP